MFLYNTYKIDKKKPSDRYSINDITIKQSSVFNFNFIQAILKYILRKKEKEEKKRKKYKKKQKEITVNKGISFELIPEDRLFGSDYTRLMTAILPYYFNYSNGWIISPEVWGNTNWSTKSRSDLVISQTDLDINSDNYGGLLPKVMIEIKQKNQVYWEIYVKDQLWKQADSLKNEEGKIWVIAIRGLEICFF